MPPAVASPGFLAALAILLANDLWWKAAYANWLTGKLSDFAGLFVVVVLATAFRPENGRSIGVFTAVAFTLWKSPLSQPLIDGWNAVAPYAVARVADDSDLLALAVIPLAVRHAGRAHSLAPAALRYPIVAVAILAILGTSMRPPHMFPPQAVEPVNFAADALTYEIAARPATIVQTLRHSGFTVERGWQASDIEILSHLTCVSPPADDRRLVHAQMLVQPLFDGATVLVRRMNLCRRDRPWDRDSAAAVFESEVLQRFGGGRRRP
jgi:hypothetical protein